MIIRATTTTTVPFADIPSAAFDVMVDTIHGADIGAM
jgi:hypothetical protein